MSQKEEILKYMQSNGGITQLQAINSLGCLRLSARIKDIERMGWVVNRERKTVCKRFGGKTDVTEYSLDYEETVYRYMKRHGGITLADAVRDLKLNRIVPSLKKLMLRGENIKSINVKCFDKNGKAFVLKRYSLNGRA